MSCKKIGKLILLVLSCSIFMGNKGCDSEEAKRRGRILKKSINSLGVRSAKIELGDQINIDIEGVINGMYLSELQDAEYFVSTNPFGGAGVQSLSSQMSLQERRSGMKFRPLSVNKTLSNSCTNDLPEAVLAGNVTSFELGNEYGVSIGFGPGGIFNGIVKGAEFTLKQMKMSLDLHSFQPLSGTHMASATKSGTKNDFGAGLGLNLGIISADVKTVFRQPVADVVRKTLRAALFDLGKEMEEGLAGEAWSARVYKDNDSHIMINAGKRHGLKKGDTLYISNMKYDWDGEPCTSRLLKQINLQDESNAIARVIIETEPSLDVAIARVFESNGVDIQEGARAYIYYLKGSKDGEDPMPKMPNPEEWVPKKYKKKR